MAKPQRSISRSGKAWDERSDSSFTIKNKPNKAPNSLQASSEEKEISKSCQHDQFKSLFNLSNLNGCSSSIQHCNLKKILNQCGEYPQKYRSLIWRFLLQLPNNRDASEAIYKRGIHPNYTQLAKFYPIKSKKLFSRLEVILSALAYWSPIFGEVEIIPKLVFPFVKVYTGDELSCFELMMSIFMNWLQNWFEFYPNPPINYLQSIDNIIAHHDYKLHTYLREDLKVTPAQYAWPVLESLFSETLRAEEWLSLMDLLITDWDQPEMLIFFSAAFFLSFKKTLLSIKSPHNLDHFLHKQNPLNIKLVYNKAVKLKDTTPSSVHIIKFEHKIPIQGDTYPLFTGYPKFIVEFQSAVRDRILQEEEELHRKTTYVEELQEKLTKLEEKEKLSRIQQEALINAEHDRRKAEALEAEIRMKERQRLDAEIRERRLNQIKKINIVLETSMKNQEDLRKAELQRLEEEISRRQAQDKYFMQSKMEEEALGLLEFKATQRLLETMRNRTTEENMRKLRNDKDSWDRELDLKEKLLQDKWQVEDEERKLRIQLMREQKQKEMQEAADTADRQKIEIQKKLQELEKEISMQDVFKDRKLRALAEEELIRNSEIAEQVKKKQTLVEKEEEKLYRLMIEEEKRIAEKKTMQRLAMLEEEKKKQENEIITQTVKIQEMEKEQRKREFEDRLMEIRKQQEDKAREEEKQTQELMLKIEEERRLQRQMHQDLIFKEQELREKQAFQRALQETEDKIIKEEKQKFERMKEEIYTDMDQIESARQKAHEMKMAAIIKQREEELQMMNGKTRKRIQDDIRKNHDVESDRMRDYSRDTSSRPIDLIRIDDYNRDTELQIMKEREREYEREKEIEREKLREREKFREQEWLREQDRLRELEKQKESERLRKQERQRDNYSNAYEPMYLKIDERNKERPKEFYSKPYDFNRDETDKNIDKKNAILRPNEYLNYEREPLKSRDEPRTADFSRDKISDDYKTRHIENRDFIKNTFHSEEEKERPYSYTGWRNTEGTQYSNKSEYKFSPERQAEILLDRHETIKQDILDHFSSSDHSSVCSSCECSESYSSQCSYTGSEESGNTPPLPTKNYTYNSEISESSSIYSQGSILSFSHSEHSPRHYTRHSSKL